MLTEKEINEFLDFNDVQKKEIVKILTENAKVEGLGSVSPSFNFEIKFHSSTITNLRILVVDGNEFVLDEENINP